ncbi:MAG: hypothetical protein N2203_06305, partial [Bacteroidia bacterium]|nr:hypothetical protein [Bacteroidia bacterium]
MKTLFIRSITGLFFGIVLIGLIYYSFDTFLLLLTLIAIGSFFELKNLFKKAQLYVNEKSLWIKSTLVFLLTIYPVFETNTSPALFNQYRLL